MEAERGINIHGEPRHVPAAPGMWLLIALATHAALLALRSCTIIAPVLLLQHHQQHGRHSFFLFLG